MSKYKILRIVFFLTLCFFISSCSKEKKDRGLIGVFKKTIPSLTPEEIQTLTSNQIQALTTRRNSNLNFESNSGPNRTTDSILFS